jgi:O-glycosyl hydrolase
MGTRIPAIAQLLLSALLAHATAVTIAVNPGVEHQVMEGIGAYGSIQPSFKKTADPVYTSQFVDLLVNDMGASMIRVQVPCAFEVQNDNGDPNVTDLNAYNISQNGSDNCKYRIRTVAQEVPYWKALQAAYAANGEQARIIATIWSPPWWMKRNQCAYGETTDNEVLPSMYDELAEYCEAFVKIFKRETGFDLYGFSFQNEPAFLEPYQSAQWTGPEYAAALKVVGKRLKEKVPGVRVFGPEDMAAHALYRFAGDIYRDPQVIGVLDVFAVHGYSNGVDPAPNADGPQVWTKLGGFCKGQGKPLWMTETSGYGTDWNGAMKLANAMAIAMYYGSASGWTHWTWQSDNIMSSSGGKGGPQYATYKHFARWIRPGAVRMESTIDNDNMIAVVFNHKAKHAFSAVVVNSNSGSLSVVLQGPGLPSTFQAFQSTSSNATARSVGTVNASGFTVPGNSITSLYAEGYVESGAVSVSGPRPARHPVSLTATAGAFYTICGRRLETSRVRQTKQAFVAVAGDASGTFRRSVQVPLR